MSTLNQSIKLVSKLKALPIVWKRPKLKGSPQRKTVILRLRICTPRKPNSARRPVIKGLMTSNFKVLAHIPGSGHALRRHCRTLVCGVGARDLPVVNYSCLRGVYDFEPLVGKLKRRSVYGLRQKDGVKTHVRRMFREFVN